PATPQEGGLLGRSGKPSEYAVHHMVRNKLRGGFRRRLSLGERIEERFVLGNELHLGAMVPNVLIDVFPVVADAVIRELGRQPDHPAGRAALMIEVADLGKPDLP